MKKNFFIILLVIMSILGTACGASKKEDYSLTNESSASMDTMNYGYSDGKSKGTSIPQESADYEDTVQTVENPAAEVTDGRKLIRNVELNIETLEFDEFIDLLETKVLATGGYIQSANASNNSYQYNRLKNANYTVRIPSNKLDEFLQMVGENANVVNTSSTTEDVTLSYYDSESRKKALEIQQDRLLDLLQKAENIEDIIQLEARLGEVTYELESQSTILRNYDNLVEYSTVSIYINEVERETQQASDTMWDKMKNGLSDTFYDIKIGMENFVVFVVVNFPYLLFWGIIITIGMVIVIRKKRKRVLVQRMNEVEVENPIKDKES